jgi:hypothetical protein
MLTSTNADPSSSSEERPYRPARSAFGLVLPERVDNPLGNLFGVKHGWGEFLGPASVGGEHDP